MGKKRDARERRERERERREREEGVEFKQVAAKLKVRFRFA